MRGASRRVNLMAAIAVVGLTAAACGGGAPEVEFVGGATPEPADTATPAPAAPTEQPRNVAQLAVVNSERPSHTPVCLLF